MKTSDTERGNSMRDVHVRESGQIPGATWTEMVMIPVEPDMVQEMRMFYGQRKELVCDRIISREELEAAIVQTDESGNAAGYMVVYRLEAEETLRFLPQSEYRVQAKITLYDGTVLKSYNEYGITADTDEYAAVKEEGEY